jgi:hypothetical protein
MDQPYRNFALDVLEPQRFPADYEELPYDDVSWAYPVGFDVAAVRIEDPDIRAARSRLLGAKPAVPAGAVEGRGPVYLLADRGQESLLAARFRLDGFRVDIAERAFAHGETEFPPGSWIVSTGDGQSSSSLRATIEAVADELALDFRSIAERPDVPHHDAGLPRIGLWVPWADTDMMGWIRYVLDQRKVPYTYLRDEDLHGGSLEDKVDVIVYGPFSRLDLAGQIHGIAATDGAIAFRRSPDAPSLGEPVASDDITGGPGYAGLAELERFVKSGGVLLTLGAGSTLALEGGLVRNVPRARAADVFTPGAELRATFVKPRHPIAYGYGGETAVFRTNLPVYETPRRWLTMAYCTSCLTGPGRRRRDGRQRRHARRGRAGRQAGHPRQPPRPGTRRELQLQRHTPGHESGGLQAGVECAAQLERSIVRGAGRGGVNGFRAEDSYSGGLLPWHT